LKGGNTLKIGKFAKKAGVTVKTLLHYDKVGILRPSDKSDSGYRVYSNDDFLRLQQILTLKFLGLSLEEIKIILNENKDSLPSLIHMQKEALNIKKRQIETVLNALEKAEGQIQTNGSVSVEALIDIIKVTKMEKKIEWVQNYITKEELVEVGKRLYGNLTKEELEKRAKDNNEFMEDIKASMNLSPDSPKAQELAKRWKNQIYEFSNGNEKLAKKLNSLYLDAGKMPIEFFEHWDPKMLEFMIKALKIFNNHE
jgi:DNA-binding transcriptional MerR regulator